MQTSLNDIHKVKAIAQKVMGSAAFAGSDRNSRIFEFLVECYFNKVHVKESVIAIDLFNNEALAFDGKIRGYMFTLRKKLEVYYESEGKDDLLIFRVRKGQYNLSVEPNTSIVVQKKGRWMVRGVAIAAFMCIAVVLILKTSKPLYCWTPFFRNNIPTLCCVGDHYVLLGDILNGKSVPFYDANVNNSQDLLALQSKDTLHTFHAADYSFVTKMGLIGTAHLSAWFAQHTKKLDVLVESELSPIDLQNNNIVYIGPYRNMQHLQHLFLATSRVFQRAAYSFVNKKTSLPYPEQNRDPIRVEHVMVSFQPISDKGNHILFITANNDIGVSSLSKNFTDPHWLRQFYKHLPSKDCYFNALFKVSGVSRTDLSCELVDIEILP